MLMFALNKCGSVEVKRALYQSCKSDLAALGSGKESEKACLVDLRKLACVKEEVWLVEAMAMEAANTYKDYREFWEECLDVGGMISFGFGGVISILRMWQALGKGDSLAKAPQVCFGTSRR